MGFKLTAQKLTDVGLVRQENQDSCFLSVDEGIGVFCVADGMGGHSNGKRASSDIVDGIRQWTSAFYSGKYNGGFSEIITDFENYLLHMNRKLYKYYNHDRICGSTIVALLVYGKYYAVFSLGDSRLYRKRGFSFLQLTQDDVWQNSDVMSYAVQDEELRQNVNYDRLTRAFGIEESVVLHRITDTLKRGDTFFLCSDGVYKYCPEKIIKNCCTAPILGNVNIDDRLLEIRKQVYKNGAPDNLTAVMVRIGAWSDV